MRSLSRRLQLEESLLKKNFGPSWRIQRVPALGAVGTLRSNGGTEYGLWLPLDDFPDQVPSAFIVSPELRTRSGRKLPELDRRMHTLDRNEHGHVQVCHYNRSYWAADVTLYKVVLKLRIWLEAYESHLRTGKAIDSLLGHQD